MSRLNSSGRLLLALPLLVYLWLPSRNFYWDGVGFALDIEKRPAFGELFNPNHLLYTVWGAGLYSAAEALGLPMRALFLMQAANAILAAGAVFLMFRILREVEVPEMSAAAGALLFAFSATWWRYATDANAYVPSILFLLGSFLLLLRRQFVGAALLHAASMCFHEIAIFFLPVGLYLGGWRFGAVSMGLTGVAYVGAYALRFGSFSLSEFVRWITIHSSDSGFIFNPLTSLYLMLRGTLRLFFGGRVGDYISNPLSWAVTAGFVSAVFLMAKCAGGLRSVRRPTIPVSVWIWLGSFLLFLLFWMPMNTFYRLFYVPPLILILCLTLAKRSQFLMAMAGVVFTWNFLFVAHPQSRNEANLPLHFAYSQRDRWPAGTPIFYGDFHSDLWTISYFNPQASWSQMPKDLDQELQNARSKGLAIWLEATAFEELKRTQSGNRWLEAHGVNAPGALYRDSKHEFRFYRIAK